MSATGEVGDMDLFSLIIGGIIGAVGCWLFMASRVDEAESKAIIACCERTEAQKRRAKSKAKLDAIRQLLDAD